MASPEYVLGHSAFELARLARQERLIGSATREYFVAAGIESGMRVLDVGSGTGAVACLAANLVGPAGQVVGTDLAAEAIAAARRNVAGKGFGNVSFQQGNPAELNFERPFDAVVGRYVLLFQADAGQMLRRLAGHLRPGGVMVFHEPDWSFVRSDPPVPLYDRCCNWVTDAFDRAGTSSNMSAKLHHAFLAAGLTSPQMRMRAAIGDSASAGDWLRAVADLVSVLTPAIERAGLATASEIDTESLGDRLISDTCAAGSMIVGRAEIGAWIRI